MCSDDEPWAVSLLANVSSDMTTGDNAWLFPEKVENLIFLNYNLGAIG